MVKEEQFFELVGLNNWRWKLIVSTFKERSHSFTFNWLQFTEPNAVLVTFINLYSITYFIKCMIIFCVAYITSRLRSLHICVHMASYLLHPDIKLYNGLHVCKLHNGQFYSNHENSRFSILNIHLYRVTTNIKTRDFLTQATMLRCCL